MADFSDLNPVFSLRLGQLRDALNKEGIGNSLVSGYRSPEYQGRMYANHLAKQAGQPLPYPNDEAPAVVARPWGSFHNYGLAADFNLTNDADYARLQSIAPQYGLSGIGMSDKGHIQLAGNLADDIAQYHLANWRPPSQPAPATGAIAYAGPSAQPSRPGTPTPGPLMFGGLNPNAWGMRNNNPGNLIASDWVTTLPGYKGKDGPFAVFDTPEHGAAALDRNLSSYGSKGINTPLGIASTWAPPGQKGNDPVAYGAQIAKALGVGPNDKIDLSDPAVRNKVSQVIGLVEQGAGNSAGFRTAYVGPTTPGTTLNSSPVTAGGPAATPAGTTLPGFQSGSPANKMAQDALKTLGGGGGGGEEPQPMRLQQAQPAQAIGGPMMMQPGGQNLQGRMVAAQDLAQRGFSMQPQLASYYGALAATRPPVASTIASMMPGQATGLPALSGTTLNSPSQLQMALMSGQMSPYDMYANAGSGGGFGST